MGECEQNLKKMSPVKMSCKMYFSFDDSPDKTVSGVSNFVLKKKIKIKTWDIIQKNNISSSVFPEILFSEKLDFLV